MQLLLAFINGTFPAAAASVLRVQVLPEQRLRQLVIDANAGGSTELPSQSISSKMEKIQHSLRFWEEHQK